MSSGHSFGFRRIVTFVILSLLVGAVGMMVAWWRPGDSSGLDGETGPTFAGAAPVGAEDPFIEVVPFREVATPPMEDATPAGERSLEVIVEGANGAPQSGVVLSLETDAGQREGVTDDSGRWRCASPQAPGRVVVLAPFDPVLAAEVTEDSTEVRLRLPLSGRLRFRVFDPDGRPFLERAELSVGCLASRDGSEIGTFDVHGRAIKGAAELPIVPVGAVFSVIVRAHGYSAATYRVEGPTAPGEHAVHDLTLGTAIANVRGRLVDETRQPLTRTHLSIRVEGRSERYGSRSAELWVTTDDEGVFEFGSNIPWAAGATRRLLVRTREPLTVRVAEVPLSFFVPKEGIDVGTVVAKAVSFVVSGRMLGLGDAPIQGGSIRIRNPGGVPVGSVSTQREGSFALEVPHRGPWSLSASAKGHRLGRPLTVTVGEDVVVRMEANGSLEIPVQLPEGVPEWCVRGELLLDDGTPGAARGERSLERGAFRFTNELAPGPYRLDVRLVGEQRLVASMRVDEATLPLDLTARVRPVRLTVASEDGFRLARGIVWFGDGEGLLEGVTLTGGQVVMATSGAASKAEVRIDGCRAIALDGLTVDTTVTPQWAAPLTLQVGSSSPLAKAPNRIEVLLVPEVEDQTERAMRLFEDGRIVARGRAPGLARKRRDAVTAYPTAVGPVMIPRPTSGRYRIEVWFVEDIVRREVTLTSAPLIDVTDSLSEIPVSWEALPASTADPR